MNKKDLKKFNQTLNNINEKCKMVINTIKEYDENVLSFGKYSVYKNDCFVIDEKNEIVRIEYLEWGFNTIDFDYIDVPFKDFNKDLIVFCRNYVDKIHAEQTEKLKIMRENAKKIKP